MRNNLPTSELSGQKLLWHSCFPSEMFSPLLQACFCQYPLSSLLGEVKENGWHMRSNPRSWVLFCGVKWPLSSFLITNITPCYSRSTISDLPVAFHQHSACILPLPNPQLKVELQVLSETNPIFYWCLEILPIPIPGCRACKHEKHNWDHHCLAHFYPFFIFPSRSPMTQTYSIILWFITYIPWLVSPHLPWRFCRDSVI